MVWISIINPRPTCAVRVTVVVLCVCVCPHAILAVCVITSKTKDTIVLSVEFEAIVKRCLGLKFDT